MYRYPTTFSHGALVRCRCLLFVRYVRSSIIISRSPYPASILNTTYFTIIYILDSRADCEVSSDHTINVNVLLRLGRLTSCTSFWGAIYTIDQVAILLYRTLIWNSTDFFVHLLQPHLYTPYPSLVIKSMAGMRVALKRVVNF